MGLDAAFVRPSMDRSKKRKSSVGLGLLKVALADPEQSGA